MPRVEFATYGAELRGKPAAAALAVASLPPGAVKPAQGRGVAEMPFLHVLLVAEDPQLADKLSALLSDALGERYARDWTDDAGQAIEMMRQNQHELYILADGASDEALDVVGACDGPAIVVGAQRDADASLAALAAGAADYLAIDVLDAPTLNRRIRQAILRQEPLARMRREIEALTTEKTRLNLLRDANHRFVENACHDFRSPLTVIKEFASIIAEGLAGDVNEEQSEFLGIILTRVDHLSAMVDGILDASRLESDVIGVRREEQPVAKLMQQARSTLEQRAASAKLQIEFSVPEGIPNVFADAESVSRVIVNLGTNACKYAGEGGRIRVWARYSADSRDVTIGVTDNGPGIAPEHVKLIFDRFQQLPKDKADQKDGFGLGLHIASELVRVNFGTLSVESEPQKGSTFSFTLPIFDVSSLIPLHFNFLRTSRHSFQSVAIAVASTAGEADATALAEVERSLHRQLRSYDLLLRLRDGNWLVCAAGDASELAKITERILGTYAEISRNRPEGRLPDLRFRTIGAWTLSARPEGLTDAIRGAYAASGEKRTSPSGSKPPDMVRGGG